jgi:3-methyladenine DNA glycosylase/8-oxoguanine DNA glycosylase
LQVTPPAGFSLEVTARSHGWYNLPPFSHTEHTLAHVFVSDGKAHDLSIRERGGRLEVKSSAKAQAARAAVTAMLQLDENLSPFYQMTDGDAALAWARRRGAGRMLRAPSMFEDLIKMLCTTNCSWSLTRVMVARLVENLGLVAPSGRRSFPTAETMAKKDERFYREVVRAGYRAPHLVRIARDVAEGGLDVEGFRTARDTGELREQLLELPGIGPYAAENLLRLLGHYDFLGLDSWCRGRLKELYPKIRDPDAFAARRYKPFGRFMGLAMWLDVTREWHE